MMEMAERKVTKWMRTPLADHDWTAEEVKAYYILREKQKKEMQTIGREERANHGGHVSYPKIEKL